MRHLRYIALIMAAVSVCMTATAAADRKIKEVKGSYSYYVPRHVPRDRAEQIAMERAMIEAIAQEFGTIVSMNTQMDIRANKNGESEDFYSSASSMVKGEWLETIGAPKFGIFLDGDDIVVTCEIKGRAREVNRAQAELDVKVLRNGTGDDAESSTFLSGDKLFLAFATPVDGYLAVYLEGDDKTVYRMLPFYAESDVTRRVKANNRYLFFASTQGDEEQYELTADKDTERNTVYVVFSPNEYVKPVDRSGSEEMGLKELPVAEFRKWLDKARALDDQLQVIPRPITITKPIND